MSKPVTIRKRGPRAGNSVLEFAIVSPMLILLVLGALTGGLTLDRYLTVQQLARNTASMFARDTDFSLDANKDLALRAATGMNMTKTGGQGVIYLSRVVLGPPGMANDGQLTVSERHVIGNDSLASSSVATLPSSNWPDDTQPLPNGFVKDYGNLAAAVANLPSVTNNIALTDSIFVVEVYHQPDNLLFAGAGMFSPAWISTKVIF